ncbi:MAG: hypothetical protein DCF22_26000 [Leptolyngbya sp.]|nr:MAG: hypothetical protein DCF22_26000 [Leptolyngbya sp.]
MPLASVQPTIQRPTFDIAVSPSPQSESGDNNTALLNCLRSGQLHSLPADCQGGLIILKSFYADFAGAGAAIGGEFDRHCTAVYTIGSVRLERRTSRVEREETLQTRIAYAEKLADITQVAVPLRRGGLIVDYLSQWLPAELAMTIPQELIGKLVGVLPVTVKLAGRSRQQGTGEMPTMIAPLRMV